MSLVPPGRLAVAATLDGRRSDLLVAADAPLVTVLAELGLPAAGAVAGADINQVLRAPASATLFAGATLDVRARTQRGNPATHPGVDPLGAQLVESCSSELAALELAVVAGIESGVSRTLGAGRYRLPSGQVIHVEATANSCTWDQAADRIETLTCEGDGSAVPSLVALGPPIDLEPTRGGAFRRPPRAAQSVEVAPIATPELPPEPSPPTPLSWASLLAPLPIALAMAYFFRPLFALFGLMGPVLVLGRWYEQRRSRRKLAMARNQAIDMALASVAGARRVQAESMAKQAWKRHPHVAHLRARAQARSVRLWERRSDDSDRLSFVVGVGPRRVDPILSSTPPAELSAACGGLLDLRSVPHVVDLVGEGGFGVYGDVSAGRSVLRSAVLQFATLRGPADLAIVVLGRDLRAWEWTKWLPHLHAPLLTEPAEEARWRQLRGRSAIVVVDDPELDVASVVRSATAAEVDVSVLSVAPTGGELPAACTHALHIAPSGRLVGSSDSLGVGVSVDVAAQWAQSLASVEDPEQSQHQAAETRLVAPTLSQALEIHGPDDILRLRTHVATPVEGSAGSLPFVLGVDGAGLAHFDLATDGPHALVAGTTGSGKSELLRTLVVSLSAARTPDDVQFVLIDFKGGGAFDSCADLPHIAGFITDLDESIVERALTGLRAEVRAREERVRAGRRLSALVVVIDEFAVLAQDYPAVLDGLVDLAARGRSLRMHMILATQKPSGVVDHRIRANTNLRIALRVQHAHESHDVVGVPDAAELDRRSPGRAIVRIGSDDARMLQVCSTSNSARPMQGAVLGPFILRGEDSERAAASGLDSDERPLEELARWVSAAGGTVAAPLWRPPLPERYAYVDLRRLGIAVSGSGSRVVDGIPIGVVDRPELREQTPFCWTPATGALAIFSGDEATIQHLVGGLVGAVVEGLGSIEHAYVVGDWSTLGTASYPCVGAVIASTDRERIERLLAMLEHRSDGERHPSLLIAVSDIGSMLAGFDDLERLEIIERLEAITRTGARSGHHLVFGARSVRDLPHRVAHHVPHRLLGAVADPTAHLLLGTKPSPAGSAMHVVDVESGAAVLVADQPTGSVTVTNKSVAAAIACCPEYLSSEELADAIPAPGGIDVPIGVRYRDLTSICLPVRWGRDLLIAGPPGAGRTNALLLLGKTLQRSGTRVVCVGSSPAIGFDSMGPNVLADLADGASEEPLVLLVDDIERLPPELASRLNELVANTARKISIIAVSTVDGARTPRSPAAAIRASGNGILVGGSPLDGEIFRVRRPELPGLGQIPGRATLVVHGRAESMHLAITSRTA